MSSLVPYNERVNASMLDRHLIMMQGWRDTFKVNYIGMATSLCADYTNLLKELHEQQALVTVEALEALSVRPQEMVVLLMKNLELLATAQASLLFPALVSTVHISNVIVRADVRGQGYGTQIMNDVVRLAGQKWGRKIPFVFQLTSQEMRGTKAFYEKLGFWSTSTIRYVRLL